jgi:hypothetical protein
MVGLRFAKIRDKSQPLPMSGSEAKERSVELLLAGRVW